MLNYFVLISAESDRATIKSFFDTIAALFSRIITLLSPFIPTEMIYVLFALIGLVALILAARLIAALLPI